MTHLLLQLLHKIPGRWRRWLRTRATPLVRQVKLLLLGVQDLRLPVYWFEAPEFRLVVIGRKHDLTHLIKASCGSVMPGEPQRKVWAWQAAATAQQWRSSSDLVVINISTLWCGLPWRRQAWRRRWFEMPALVNQIVPLPAREEEILPLVKNPRTVAELHKIQELGYRYAISRDPGQFAEFYHEYYKPYITSRFGETAYVAPLEHWLQGCEGNDLLLVRRGDVPVAGAINRRQDDGYLMDYIGTRGVDPDLLQQGAAGACYYFTLVEAFRQGCRWVGLGRSLPFLNDGVLFFKKKWASQLGLDTSLQRRLWLDCDLATDALQHLLTGNPLILLRGFASDRVGGPDALYGLMLLDLSVWTRPKELRAWLKRVSDAGLMELVMLVLHAEHAAALKIVRETIPNLPNPVRLVMLEGSMPAAALIELLSKTRLEPCPELESDRASLPPSVRREMLDARQTVN
jgi:hypothetical protein